MEHYTSHQVYVNSTISEQIGDTVEFFQHHIKFSFMYSSDCTSLATEDLMEALLHPNIEATFALVEQKKSQP